jgi:hypothetical protein
MTSPGADQTICSANPREVAMGTSVTDEVKRLDDAESRFSSSAEPWLSRREWMWTLFGLALLITFLRFAVEHP